MELCSILLGATLLSLAGIDVVLGQTVESCTLQNVVINVGPSESDNASCMTCYPKWTSSHQHGLYGLILCGNMSCGHKCTHIQ